MNIEIQSEVTKPSQPTTNSSLIDYTFRSGLDSRVSFLLGHLQSALATPIRNFDELSTLGKRGLYLVFQNDIIIYAGKTTRAGKNRLREMVSDYRSHTLNQKLLKLHLETTLNQPLAKFNLATKKSLIEQAVLTEEEFKTGQKNTNSYIKTQLSFKFYEFETDELTALEHFAISVLNPKYND